MPDIFHDIPIKASRDKIFRAVSTPEGLASWWTNRSSGEPSLGAEFHLWFSRDYDWRAVVSRCVPDTEFELEMTKSDNDWIGSRVRFVLAEKDGVTQLRFAHTGWPEANDHYRGSCFCWALYLRLLKRYVERGEIIPYDDRDSA